MKTHDPNINPVSEYYVYTPSITAKKLFFYLTHIGYYHYDSNYYLKRSNFQSFLIMLILDGECDVKLDTQSFHEKKAPLYSLTVMPHMNTEALLTGKHCGFTLTDHLHETITII